MTDDFTLRGSKGMVVIIILYGIYGIYSYLSKFYNHSLPTLLYSYTALMNL